MTITCTSEDLSKFYGLLSEWSIKRMQYVFDHIRLDRHNFEESPREIVRKLLAEFDKANPCPDWRRLL